MFRKDPVIRIGRSLKSIQARTGRNYNHAAPSRAQRRTVNLAVILGGDSVLLHPDCDSV